VIRIGSGQLVSYFHSMSHCAKDQLYPFYPQKTVGETDPSTIYCG